MDVIGLIIFILCLVVIFLTDELSVEDSYKIYKYWQGGNTHGRKHL